MTTVRLGIIGFGAQGSSYARFLADGRVRDLVVTAVADVDPARQAAAAALAPGASFHADHRSLLASGEVDAVVVCTPHYLHPGIGIDALEHGLHVLVDKPAGVYAAQVAELNEAAAARPGQRFAIMFNQRANPLYRRLKEVVDEGGIGRILRSNWIITTWWRPQATSTRARGARPGEARAEASWSTRRPTSSTCGSGCAECRSRWSRRPATGGAATSRWRTR